MNEHGREDIVDIPPIHEMYVNVTQHRLLVTRVCVWWVSMLFPRLLTSELNSFCALLNDNAGYVFKILAAGDFSPSFFHPLFFFKMSLSDLSFKGF